MRAKRYTTRLQGFTLSEMAIVLGIIGFIMGLAWSVSSSVAAGNKLNQASNDLHVVLTNVRSYYSGQNASYTFQSNAKQTAGHGALQTSPATNDFAYYSSLLGAASAFPLDMPVVANGAQIPNNLGMAQIALGCTQTGPGSCGEPVRIVVRYSNIADSSVCAGLLARNSLPEQSTGLNKIMVNGTALPTLPGQSSDIQALCNGAGPFTIDWYYVMG